MSIKTLAIAKLKQLGITNWNYDPDTEHFTINACAGHSLRITVRHPEESAKPKKGQKKADPNAPTVELACARAKSWAELHELLMRTKHVKIGGAS